MRRKFRLKPRTRAGAKIDPIQVGCAGCRTRLSENCSGQQCSKSKPSTPVIGKLYFLEQRQTRTWPLARGSVAEAARPKAMVATPTDAALLWCEGGEDFFKARVSPQRIPKRQQFQLAIGEAARGTDGDGKLFAGEIFVANPRGDHR
jgi:hypothetical protein